MKVMMCDGHHNKRIDLLRVGVSGDVVVSNHIAESSRKNLYNFYGNSAIFVDQVLEFSLFNRNKKPPSALCADQGLKGVLKSGR